MLYRSYLSDKQVSKYRFRCSIDAYFAIFTSAFFLDESYAFLYGLYLRFFPSFLPSITPSSKGMWVYFQCYIIAFVFVFSALTAIHFVFFTIREARIKQCVQAFQSSVRSDSIRLLSCFDEKTRNSPPAIKIALEYVSVYQAFAFSAIHQLNQKQRLSKAKSAFARSVIKYDFSFSRESLYLECASLEMTSPLFLPAFQAQYDQLADACNGDIPCDPFGLFSSLCSTNPLDEVPFSCLKRAASFHIYSLIAALEAERILPLKDGSALAFDCSSELAKSRKSFSNHAFAILKERYHPYLS